MRGRAKEHNGDGERMMRGGCYINLRERKEAGRMQQ